jgi:hypothetical protein
MNELKDYLETMRQIASESYHKVRNMCNDFRSVRQRLTIVSDPLMYAWIFAY